VLYQVGVLGAVLVPDRLDRVLERLLVGEGDHLDPRVLDLLHRLRLALVPELPLLELGLLRELPDQVLVGLRERIPAPPREHQDLRDDQVLGQRVELGELEVAEGVVARRVVLGAVDDAGLQRVVDLVHAHGDAVAAEGVHGVDEDGIAHHPDLEALEVVDRTDRALDVVDAAGAGIHPGEPDQPRLRIGADLLHQLLADRTVDHLPHVRHVAEDEGHVEDVELVDDGADRADRDAGELQRPDLGLLDHLLLAAELHRREHLDREPAGGRGLQLLAHALDRLDGGVAEHVHVGGLQHLLLLGRGRKHEREREGGGKRGQTAPCPRFHVVSSQGCRVALN
jgi:hypothetical protein